MCPTSRILGPDGIGTSRGSPLLGSAALTAPQTQHNGGVERDSRKRPTICLSVIVRNEAHIVHELIEAVAPHIDTWVIVDTGSSDGTQDLIRRLMGERGIPGELHERPWQDFGHNRSEALTLAQGHADYIWVMDADDTVTGTIDFSDLHADGYSMRIRDGLTYWRIQLFRDGLPWRYVGILHEAPACDTPHSLERLEGEYQIHSRRLGARSRDPRKYARDAELLQAEVDRNPEDSRSVFYLAHSYLWAEDFANARRWFERRAEMGGWEEEVFLSMCRAAEAMEHLDEHWPDVQQVYLSAWSFRPTRAESLYAIARHYRLTEQYLLGHLFAQVAAQIPMPVEDSLFVVESIYAWQALDEQAVCASWIGKSPESFAICRRLLRRDDLPDGDRQRIASNRDLAVQEMIAIASDCPADTHLSAPVGRPADVTVTLMAGPDLGATQTSLNSFLNCCLDRDRIGRYIVLDSGLSAADKTALLGRYEFLEFRSAPSSNDPLAQLIEIREHVDSRYWLHLGQGPQFFAPETFIARLTGVLDAEPEVCQVGINFEDSPTLTGRSAAEIDVRRAADGGRYVVPVAAVTGPAMFDTARFDARAVAGDSWQVATLDEVLWVAPGSNRQPTD